MLKEKLKENVSVYAGLQYSQYPQQYQLATFLNKQATILKGKTFSKSSGGWHRVEGKTQDEGENINPGNKRKHINP